MQIVVAIAVFATGWSDARADYSEGGAFRATSFGARAWGMAGAAVATVDDEGAVYWNPAMMTYLQSSRFGASYINLVSGLTAWQSQVAYARVLKPGPVTDDGRQLARHAVGAIYTNVHLDLQGGSSYDENMLRLAYAFTPDYFVSIGAAFEVLTSSSEVSNFGSLGSSLDASARLLLTEHLRMGFVLRNIFSRVSYENGSDVKRQRSAVLGFAYDGYNFATIETDLVYDHGALGRAIVGAESKYILGHLALRGGLLLNNAGERRYIPHFGFGFRFSHLLLHYNANLDHTRAFEDTHRFSLSLGL